MFANGGDVKCYLFHMSICHREHDMDLLGYSEEIVTSDSLGL